MKLKQAQLTQLGTVMENLVTSLASLTTPQLIAAVEKKYQDAEAEHHRLSQEIAALSAHIASIEGVKAVRDSYQTVVDDWDGSSRDMQREVVHSFLDHVKVKKLPGRSRLHLTICWRDGSEDEIDMGKKGGRGTVWLPQDAAKLVEVVESGASQVEIAQAFPDLEWAKIYGKYCGKTRKFPDLPGDRPIGKNETYNDYLERIGCSNATSGSRS